MKRLSGNKPDKKFIIYWERPEEKLFGFQKTFRPSNNHTNNVSMFPRKALFVKILNHITLNQIEKVVSERP